MEDLRKLARYFKPYKKSLAVGVCSIFASVAVSLMIPRVIRDAVNGLRGGSQASLALQALMILGVTCASTVFMFLTRRVMDELSRKVVHDLRHDFYAQLQRQTRAFFQTHSMSTLMTQTTDGMESVRQLAGPLIQSSLQTIFSVALTLPLMIHVSPSLTLLFFITIPPAFVVVQFFRRKTRARLRQMTDVVERLAARMRENILGVRVVRAFAQEEAQAEAFRELNQSLTERSLNVARINALMQPLLQFLIGTGFVLHMWYGGTLIIRGEMTLGHFAEFNAYLMRVMFPLIATGQTVRLYQQGMITLKRINAILGEVPAIADGREVRQQPTIAGRIEFRNLTFSYAPGSEPVLRDINLVIEAGQTVALVGRTGSGKSTMANLIPRLLEAPRGTLFIDGVPIHDYALAQLRSSIGFVRQDLILFSDSLSENIAFGVEHAETADFDWVIEATGLAEDVRGFPKGLETMIGERGVTFSGGQRQRVGIARALLRRPRILIFDDSFSSIDTNTEEKILSRLRDVLRERTSLIISHRISTVRHADLICLLDGGAIVERGTHDELLAHGGEYAKLYEQQTLDADLEAFCYSDCQSVGV